MLKTLAVGEAPFYSLPQTASLESSPPVGYRYSEAEASQEGLGEGDRAADDRKLVVYDDLYQVDLLKNTRKISQLKKSMKLKKPDQIFYI